MRLAALRLCALVLALAGGAAAHAQEDALARVRRTAVISLGANDDAAPLSYLWRNEHQGYQVAVCQRVVEAIRRRLGLAELKVRTVTTTQATRLALLNNGTIDIACGHNPVTVTGVQQARLSHATVVLNMRAMTTADHAGRSLDKIGGLRVASAVGDLALGRLRAHVRQHALDITSLQARTTDEMWTLLENNRADVLLLPDVYLLALRARSATPERYVLMDGLLGKDPVALMFRTGDDELAQMANDVIAAMMRSGEMARLHRRWFLAPFPGAERGIGLEVSSDTQALFDSPGSEMQAL